jgi:hypothetical protein
VHRRSEILLHFGLLDDAHRDIMRALQLALDSVATQQRPGTSVSASLSAVGTSTRPGTSRVGDGTRPHTAESRAVSTATGNGATSVATGEGGGGGGTRVGGTGRGAAGGTCDDDRVLHAFEVLSQRLRDFGRDTRSAEDARAAGA